MVLNPFLDSFRNFGFKNIGLTPGIPKLCFQHPQDVVTPYTQILPIQAGKESNVPKLTIRAGFLLETEKKVHNQLVVWGIGDI
jgi:hypothetical protein